MAHPYNFYIFPKQFRGQDRRFLCQTRCINFLADSNFDFNKLFRSGIPFMNADQEQTARDSPPEHEVIASVRKKVASHFYPQHLEPPRPRPNEANKNEATSARHCRHAATMPFWCGKDLRKRPSNTGKHTNTQTR